MRPVGACRTAGGRNAREAAYSKDQAGTSCNGARGNRARAPNRARRHHMGEARSGLHDLIWTIEGKGLAEGRAETEKHMVGRLLKELRKIGSGSTETALEVRMAVLAVAGAVKTLSEDRNLIVHGTWGELDGVPTVGSLQLETIDRNDVTFESFPPDRLRDFIRDVTACRDQAMAIIAQVGGSRRRPG